MSLDFKSTVVKKKTTFKFVDLLNFHYSIDNFSNLKCFLCIYKKIL